MATTIFQNAGGDWDLSRTNSTGKKALSLVRNSVYVAAIKLRNRFKMQLGEWRYDTRIGIPFREVVLKKGTPIGVIKRIFTDVILSLSPVIVRVDLLEIVPDKSTRVAAVYFRAIGDDGQALEGGTDRPFIVGSEYTAAAGAR